MNKKYNVLWIDDQHESLKAVHKTAADYDVKLWPFKSMNGGCNNLVQNLTKYDAVLLDAKFFENETDQPGSEDTKWVHQTKDRIRDLDKSLKYFVLTGQAKTYASEEFKNAFEHVFDKGKDEDEDTLFTMLVDACKNRELTKLKLKYPNQFDMCTDAYLGKKHFERVHNLILEIENPSTIKIAQDSLNGIRKTIEALFIKLNKFGCIPDEIKNDKGWINGSSIFLAGRNNNYTYKAELIHPVIAFQLHKILEVTQDASHDVGSKLGVDDFLYSNTNTFLYQSTVLLLLDTLSWFKSYFDINNNKDSNLAKWECKDVLIETSSNMSISGKVINLNAKGYAFLKPSSGTENIYIHKSLVDEYKLKDNDLISGEFEAYNDSKTQEKKLRMIKIKKTE